MTDIVEILHNYCEANNIEFVYGRKSSLNLLDNRNKLQDSKIYLMAEPPTRTPLFTNIGKIKGYSFKGAFFLVKNSNIDMPIYNEVANYVERSKYMLNVKPLLATHKSFLDYLSCTDIEVKQCDAIDVYDIFDQNKDGLLVQYIINSNEY